MAFLIVLLLVAVVVVTCSGRTTFWGSVPVLFLGLALGESSAGRKVLSLLVHGSASAVAFVGGLLK